MNQLPAIINDEAAMVAIIGDWIDRTAEWLTSETGRLRMRMGIRDAIQQGTVPMARAIEMAMAGHQDADIALREMAAEIWDRGEEPPALLKGYAIGALFRAPINYPPGNNIVDTWTRDIGIACIVMLAAERWNLRPTRGRASK